MKYFTPKEALQTLPLVRKIVKDILTEGEELKLIAQERGPEIQTDPVFRRKLNNINACMAELEEIGCFYKDWNFTMGLVDFPARINGQEVFLCWRSDEDTITHYHGQHDGYAGRLPIPEQYLN